MVYRGARRFRAIRGPRDKYSVENTAFSATTTVASETLGSQAAIGVVPPTTVEGMRKVKHLKVSLTTGASGVNQIMWALVFVPQGYAPNNINPAGNMYEPNQFVMNCGIVDVDAGPIRFSSPVSRNLNSGDSIYLILQTPTNAVVRGVVSYAVTLQ